MKILFNESEFRTADEKKSTPRFVTAETDFLQVLGFRKRIVFTLAALAPFLSAIPVPPRYCCVSMHWQFGLGNLIRFIIVVNR